MNRYLTKPFSITELTEVLRDFLGESIGIQILGGEAHTKPEEIDGLQTIDSPRLEIINKSAVNNIREVEKQTGRSILPTIFEGFQSQMNDKLIELESDVSSGDPQALYRTAHAIKSMSANIGAEQVRRHSSNIEIMGRSGSIEGVKDAIQPLKDAYANFIVQFEAEIKD